MLLVVAWLASFGAAQGLQDWAVQPGYRLEVDSRGFTLPTALAFVPEPGDAPGDPLYFVTELQGAVKVVANDRSVRTFATVPTFQGQSVKLTGTSQQGLAGICLDAATGYVFVTFSYHDAGGAIRNNLVRFATRPGSFAAAPSEVAEYPELFADYQSSPSHQIGGCVVHEGRLYVGVGDGGNAAAAQNPDILLGKVLCFTLALEPCRTESVVSASSGSEAPISESSASGEPTPADFGGHAPANYVYAMGFRNPFGLTFAGDELFVVENGVDIDRFALVEAGGNYNWNGSDQSIAAGAALAIVPAISPVQLAYIPEDTAFVDETLRGSFAFAVFGPEEVNAGVVALRYDFGSGRVPAPPRYLLEHVGAGLQHMTGFALGPDGLYAVPIAPDSSGQGYVLKLSYDPSQQHPVAVEPRSTLVVPASLGLLGDYPCTSCHTINGQGGGIGPSLDHFAFNWRITERLNSSSYERRVAAVDALEDPLFARYREARREVLEAQGRERTYVWLGHFLQEPRFDNPDVAMPNLGLSEAEAHALRDELYRVSALEIPGTTPPLPLRLAALVRRDPRPVLVGALAGFALGALATLLLWFGIRHLRSGKAPGGKHDLP